MIELTRRGGDTEFRQQLLQKAIDFQQDVADIDAEIARINDYTKVFAQPDDIAENSDAAKAAFVKRLNEQLPAAVEKLRGYAAVTTRIAYRIRYAQDIHSVTNPGENTAVGIDFYLREAKAVPPGAVGQLLNQLKGYATVANRLYDQVSLETLGKYQNLFNSASDPKPVPQKWISRYELLLLALAALGGLLLALAGGLMFRAIKARKVT